MMRRLFVVLLAANVLYAGWTLLSPRERAEGGGRRPAAPAYASLLELASEYSPAPQAPVEVVADVAPGEPGDAGADAADLAAAALQPSAAAAGAAVIPGASPAETTAVAPVAAPGAAVATDARPLPEAPAPSYCLRIGPLRDGAEGERLRQRVREWLPAARVEEGEAPDRSSYWVHIPPRASDAEASAVVRALKARGVDSFVIRDEPALLHGVSLGVFRDPDSAKELSERRQGIGYPVAIHEKPRTRRAFFVVGATGADAGPAVPPALGEAIAAASPGAQVAPAGCDGIAPVPASD